MDKRAKILASIAVIFSIILILIVSTNLISAQNWQDYLKLEYNTDYCLEECEAIFTITNPTLSAISLGSNDVRLWHEVSKGPGLVGNIEVYREEEVSYVVEIPEYENCSYESNGTLIEYICQTGSHTETRTKKEFLPFDFSGKTLSKDATWRIKIVGHKKPSLGENNIEWLLDFKGMQPPWAWWLSNYSYVRVMTANSTIGSSIAKVPVSVNGTEGFRDAVNREQVWCLMGDLPAGNINGSLNFYYNSSTDYRCVNASDNKELLQDKEMGNGTASSISKARALWQGSYHNLVWHMSDIIDSSGLHSNATTSSAAYSDTSIFGKSIYLSGTTSKFHLPADDINEGMVYSLEFWVYDNSFAAEEDLFSIWGGSSNKNLLIESNSSGGISVRELQGGCGSTTWGYIPTNVSRATNKWYYIAITKSGAGNNIETKVYLNGKIVGSSNTGDNCNISSDGWGFGRPLDTTSPTAWFDEFRFLNKTLNEEEIRARYEMLTPSLNWSILGPEISTGAAVLSESEGDSAILEGVANSAINSSYANYSDQQVYTVNVTGQHQLARFDVVAVSGNQRWAFNYISDNESTSNFTYMVNITPVLYVWEAANLTNAEIQQQVTALIDSTKI